MPMPTISTPNRYFRDYPLIGHIADVAKPTKLTQRSGHSEHARGALGASLSDTTLRGDAENTNERSERLRYNKYT